MHKVLLTLLAAFALFVIASPASAQRRCGPQFVNGTIHLFPPCDRQHGWQHGPRGRYWGPSRPHMVRPYYPVRRTPVMIGGYGYSPHGSAVMVRRTHRERHVHVERSHSRPAVRHVRKRVVSCARPTPVKAGCCCGCKEPIRQPSAYQGAFIGPSQPEFAATSNKDVVPEGFYVIKR